jgi:restriction system protein
LTKDGEKALKERGDAIDVAFLRTIPQFVTWHETGRRGESSETIADDRIANLESPEDTLERVAKRLNADLAQDLLDRIKGAPPSFFEKLVVDLMLKMGYGGSRAEAGRTLGKTGDGGVDGVIDEDRLGLDVIYLQAKRWEGAVGRPVVQTFVGSLAGMRANKGVLITTSAFTGEARAYVQQIGAKVVLIDGEMLGTLMIQYGLAVATVATYEVKRVDSDYFDE